MPQHGLVVSAILVHLDFLDEQIERLSAMLEEQLRPFAAGRAAAAHHPRS